MSYYAYIGKVSCVFEKWSDVNKKIIQYPYSSYRKFKYKEDAWEYVSQHSKNKNSRILHTGYDNKEFSIVAKYFIYKSSLYINYILPKTIEGNLITYIENVRIIKTLTNIIMVQINDTNLNFHSAKDHAKAVYKIIELLGNIVDINIYIYDNSIYYASYYYTGSCKDYLDLQRLLKNRIGRVGYTYEQYGYTELSQEAFQNQRLYERECGRKNSVRGFEEI